MADHNSIERSRKAQPVSRSKPARSKDQTCQPHLMQPSSKEPDPQGHRPPTLLFLNPTCQRALPTGEETTETRPTAKPRGETPPHPLVPSGEPPGPTGPEARSAAAVGPSTTPPRACQPRPRTTHHADPPRRLAPPPRSCTNPRPTSDAAVLSMKEKMRCGR